MKTIYPNYSLIKPLTKKLLHTHIQNPNNPDDRRKIKILTLFITPPLHPVNIMLISKSLVTAIALTLSDLPDPQAQLLHLHGCINQLKRLLNKLLCHTVK